jgi:O-antigen/teichoic acid export membrane protein
MSEIVNQSLQKIAKGTGIIFIGTIIGLLLGFVSRVIIVRYITQTEYGIYSMTLVLMSIFVTISTLGLQEGSTRYIAYFRGKDEEGKVKGIISSSIKIAIIASVISALILFLSSGIISSNIFHSAELSTPLKIFSVAIPFTVLIGIFASLFRGFGRVEPNVYFQNILRSVTSILFLVGAVLLGLSFFGVLYAYLASIAITCIAFAIYTLKKLPLTSSVKKDACWAIQWSFTISSSNSNCFNFRRLYLCSNRFGSLFKRINEGNGENLSDPNQMDFFCYNSPIHHTFFIS